MSHVARLDGRPLVFAVGDADGNLHIYDLKRSRGCPEATLKVTRNRSPVYAIVFNPRSPQLLATADGEGFVKVWRLSGALSTMAPREQVCCARDSVHSARRVVNSVGAAGAGIARQAGDSEGRRASSGGRRCRRQRRVRRLRWRGRVRPEGGGGDGGPSEARSGSSLGATGGTVRLAAPDQLMRRDGLSAL